MDLHLLRTPASQFNNGDHFTVRSASSPSYGLTRRPGIRKTGAASQEEKTEDWKTGKPKYPLGSMSGIVQRDGNDHCSHVKVTNITCSGSTDKTTKGLNTDSQSNSPQHFRGRAEWRSFNTESRSKSLDWRTDPDRVSRLTNMSVLPSEQSNLTVKDRRVMSSIETYNSTRESICLPRSLSTRSLNILSRGHSIPTRIKSPTNPVLRSNSSLGTRGGQSILERIEKLYGSTHVGKMEEDSKFRDFASSDSKGKSSTFHFEGFTGDSALKRRSSEVTHGTFPRRLSGTEWSRNSLTMTPQMDTHRLSFDSSLRARGTTERAPECQSHMLTKYSWDSGAKGDSMLIKTGTQSLDRARSRNAISGQIRAARVSNITAPHAVLHNTSSKYSTEDNMLFTNGINGAGHVEKTVEDQHEDKDAKTDLIRNAESRFSSTDDVFKVDTQNRELKLMHRKAFSLKTPVNSAASVRNKINQFEAMTQRGLGQSLMHRRAFSMPTQHGDLLDGVKKSASARAIGSLRDKWEGLAEGREAGNKPEETSAAKETRKEEKHIHNPIDEDFVFRRKRELEIPLNNSTQDAQFYIDERYFSKALSPEDDGTAQIPGAEQTDVTKQPTAVTSPSSDLDKTPTNTPRLSPTPSADKQPEISSTLNNSKSMFTFPESHNAPSLLRPLATSSHSNIPKLISPESEQDKPSASKPLSDLEAWVSNWNSGIKVWNDSDSDDDESTQKDGDSNYDSDSGESSVTITSNISQSDNRSFSVSLSDLYNFAGVDCESEHDSESVGRRSASLSSDMSALSYVSVLPTEELDRLIEDVKGLGENSLQDDVHVVVLHKEVGVGLGFSLAGGVDQNKPVTVHRVFHTGVAAQEGSVQERDEVLSINGTALSGCAHWEALRVLRRAKTREMGVVVLRKGGSVPKKGVQAKTQEPPETATEISQQLCVRLEKNSRDLGFSLEGGSGLENRPLTVQKIFQGGPVDKVYPGDELLEVEGMSMLGMRRLEAWTLIRRLPPGPVDVILSRPIKRQEK